MGKEKAGMEARKLYKIVETIELNFVQRCETMVNASFQDDSQAGGWILPHPNHLHLCLPLEGELSFTEVVTFLAGWLVH